MRIVYVLWELKREVSYQHGGAQVTATLLLPATKGPFPALMHGIPVTELRRIIDVNVDARKLLDHVFAGEACMQ